MKVSTGEPFSKDGWTGRLYELTPDAPGRDAHTLELSVEDAYADWVSDRMEAPALAALFIAMALNEPLLIDAPLSARFHYNLRQIIKYFHHWYPDQLSIIDVKCAGFDEAQTSGTNTLGCFSGGVDSYFTLKDHRNTTEPTHQYRMTHGLFAHGFDISLEKTDYYNQLAEQYGQILENENVRLVRFRTNLREFLDPYVEWLITHGAALDMAAHFLSEGVSKFIIPSTVPFMLSTPPLGSNSLTDVQLIHETLEIIHHGCEASRVQKIIAIADWPVVQKNLRVCFQELEPPVLNCGNCKKCHRIMTSLWVAGKLDQFECFPKGFHPTDMEPDSLIGYPLEIYPQDKSYEEELLAVAKKDDPNVLKAISDLFHPRKTGAITRKLSPFLRGRR